VEIQHHIGYLAYDRPPVGVHTPVLPGFRQPGPFDDSVAEGVLDLQDAIDANTPDAGDRVIIVGYSQSGRIATIAKRDFLENYDPADPDATPIGGFAMLSNPGKPNGGILQRYKFFGTIPFFGITFDGDTPTHGPQNPDGSYVAPTKDISFLYDGVSDHPVWALSRFPSALTTRWRNSALAARSAPRRRGPTASVARSCPLRRLRR
jgi:pimeloyl-ACP methyl ester carboxylesterase